MTQSRKPNWSNRVIIVVFAVLAIVTIGAAIYATTSEWAAVDAGPEEWVTTEPALPADEPLAETAQ